MRKGVKTHREYLLWMVVLLQQQSHPDSRLNRTRHQLVCLKENVPPDHAAGLAMFPGRCGDNKVVWADSITDRQPVVTNIVNSKTKGYTSAAESPNRAARLLRNKMGEPAITMVVSNGLYTCEGNPCTEAERILQLQPNVVINIVSLGTEGEADSEAFDFVAAATGGKKCQSDSYAEMQAALLNAAEVVSEHGTYR